MKFLVIGPGLIGHKHIQLIQDNEECSVEAIVALHPERHIHYENEIGASVYSNLESVFSNHQIDAVIISSPNELHYEQAIFCIDKNIPVLVEKPLTDHIDSAELLVKYAEEKKVPVLVGHHRTYSSFMPKAKALLNSKQFGQLVSVQGSALFYKPSHYFLEGEWRTKKGGGPILINLIHEIGILRSLCGEIKRVFAFSSNKTRQYEVEDTVAISFEFENGSLGSFILSDCAASTKSWEMTSGENPAYPHYPEEACYHFSGSNGSLDFPSMKFAYYGETKNASWWKPFEHKESTFEIKEPLSCQLEHFIQVIKQKSAPLVTARSGYNNMRVLDAIQQSILQGKFVELIN